MIESSFAQQYGIRLRSAEMTYSEFATLLSGLLPDTPLGKVITIRSEMDSEVLKTFNPDQKRIRSEWMLHRNEVIKSDTVAYNKRIENIQNYFKYNFGN